MRIFKTPTRWKETILCVLNEITYHSIKFYHIRPSIISLKTSNITNSFKISLIMHCRCQKKSIKLAADHVFVNKLHTDCNMHLGNALFPFITTAYLSTKTEIVIKENYSIHFCTFTYYICWNIFYHRNN